MLSRSLLSLVGCALAAATFGCDEMVPTPPPVASARADERGPSMYEGEVYRQGLEKLMVHAGKATHALKLDVFPNRIVLQVQDAEKSENVDQYVYRHGHVEGPIPVKLKGPGKVEDNVFPLAEAKLDRVPALVEQALAEAAVEKGRVTEVSLRRNLPDATDVLFTISISGPRRDAKIEADHEGNLLAPEEK